MLQVLVLIAAALAGSSPTTAAEHAAAAPHAAAASAPADQRDWGSRLIITMAPGVRAPNLDGAQTLQQRGQFAIVDLGRRVQPSDLARFAGPGVLSVEPDLILHPTVTPNDARWSDQWDMNDAGAGAADYSVHAPDAWAITTGSAAITIAVVAIVVIVMTAWAVVVVVIIVVIVMLGAVVIIVVVVMLGAVVVVIVVVIMADFFFFFR